MPIASPVYAIVIPAYNEVEELPATLAAVRRAMAEYLVFVDADIYFAKWPSYPPSSYEKTGR